MLTVYMYQYLTNINKGGVITLSLVYGDGAHLVCKTSYLIQLSNIHNILSDGLINVISKIIFA